MKISSNFRLEVAQKIQYDDCFYASQKHQLALQISKKNSIVEDLKIRLTIDENFDVDRSRSSSENSKIRIIADEMKEKFEENISFKVTVYENKAEIR
jgi:hypothetical protein